MSTKAFRTTPKQPKHFTYFFWQCVTNLTVSTSASLFPGMTKSWTLVAPSFDIRPSGMEPLSKLCDRCKILREFIFPVPSGILPVVLLGRITGAKEEVNGFLYQENNALFEQQFGRCSFFFGFLVFMPQTFSINISSLPIGAVSSAIFCAACFVCTGVSLRFPPLLSPKAVEFHEIQEAVRFEKNWTNRRSGTTCRCPFLRGVDARLRISQTPFFAQSVPRPQAMTLFHACRLLKKRHMWALSIVKLTGESVMVQSQLPEGLHSRHATRDVSAESIVVEA